MALEHQIARLVVLSDLHLAPPGEQCVFAAHEPLVALINFLAAMSAEPMPQWLLLNGDVFDFLQIPGYDALSLPLAPKRMTDILDALDAEPSHRNVVQALCRFTAAGHRLCCMPGNHDAELNLVAVQQVLTQRLGSSTVLPSSQGYWDLTIAGHAVVGCHGHHADAFNAIGGAQMQKAQADGDATVTMPPGSRLVCKVINPFRRAKTPDGTPRFPFIDRLPSDQAVLLAIMLLDPRLAGKRLKDALGISAAALVRKALINSGLSGPSLSVAELPVSTLRSDWMTGLTNHLACGAATSNNEANARATASQLEYELDAYFAVQLPSSEQSVTSLAASDGLVRKLLWRAFGLALASTCNSFRADVADSLALQVASTWGHGVIAITGHTHAAKSIQSTDGSLYLNTGTWLDQVMPPLDTRLEALEDWLNRLQKNQVPSWNGMPVAVVDEAGGRLMRWDGNELSLWSDKLS